LHNKKVALPLSQHLPITITDMTTAQLSQRIIADRTSSYGHYKVTIQYRGKEYSCISTDSMAYDRYNDEDAKGRGIYTQKDALQSLWSECKRKNNLF
jgi:hypothetical protein